MADQQVLVIIQARMVSSRLPGKIMLPICNKPALQVMIERLNPLREIYKVIIATTNDGTEAPIIKLCRQLDISYFKGDPVNVLQRYYEAARAFNAKNSDIIVRLTSDCPLIDPQIVKKIIRFFQSNDFDYASNTLKTTFPNGFATEVFSYNNLRIAYENAAERYEKEHVTPYFYLTHKSEYKLGSYIDQNDNSKYRLTLDEEADIKAIQEVYNKFNCSTDFSYQELISMLNKNPYIYQINMHIRQKKIQS